ncbi:MAG TPA: CBS domain-containing protein [Nitrososphaeraceae archaeon]
MYLHIINIKGIFTFIMLPGLEYIKQTRLKLGITQRRLASLTGISTSMINQIETGRCKPSYDTAKNIFEILSTLEGKSSKKAGDICSRNIIFAQKDDSLYSIVEKMRIHFVSQVPIFEGQKIVGIVSEDSLAKRMVENDEKKLKNITIDTVMEPSPPLVDSGTPAKALVPLIRFAKCILVTEKGNVIGIITTTDILKMVE